MPKNDGTLEDEAVDDTDDGKYYQVETVVNDYLFQDEVIADNVKKYITGGNAEGVKPRYYGKPSSGRVVWSMLIRIRLLARNTEVPHTVLIICQRLPMWSSPCLLWLRCSRISIARVAERSR